MEALFNAMVALGLLLMLVLIIYLLDRINTLERETRRVAQSLAKPVQTDAWAGLSGRRLWDAMTGKPPDNMDAVTLADVRERYDLVLHRHIEALYQEGWRDGARGMSATPANTRLIATARGSVESWLPAPQANTFYRCGLDASQTPVQAWGPIRLAMDEAGQILYEKAQIQSRSALSGWLMPDPVAQADAQADPTTPSP